MQIIAQRREITGSKTKQIRLQKLIPAVVFGKKTDSMNLQIKYNDFVKLLKQAGETEIVDLKIEGEKEDKAVLINEVQKHPVTEKIIHVSFYEVDLTQKIRVQIPIEYIGEEEHELIKNKEALLIPLIAEVEVEALPKDLPRGFEISITSLKEIGDLLTIKDLKQAVDTSKVEILEEDDTLAIAKLDYAETLEVEEPEEEMSVEDIEITGEKAKEEGEAEGDKKEEEKKEEKAEKPKEEEK